MFGVRVSNITPGMGVDSAFLPRFPSMPVLLSRNYRISGRPIFPALFLLFALHVAPDGLLGLRPSGLLVEAEFHARRRAEHNFVVLVGRGPAHLGVQFLPAPPPPPPPPPRGGAPPPPGAPLPPPPPAPPRGPTPPPPGGPRGSSARNCTPRW